MNKLTLLSILLLCAPRLPLLSQNTQTKPILQGLRSVSVIVDLESFDAARQEGDSSTIQNIVELELRKSGITVTDPMHSQTDLRLTFCGVTIQPKGTNDVIGHTFTVATLLFENGIVPRNGTNPYYVSTWQGPVVIRSTGKTGVNESVKQVVQDIAIQFANEYLAANPKKP